MVVGGDRSATPTEARPIARNSTPQTFEKRRRERDKQQKKAEKAAARRERSARKKAIKDGEIVDSGPDPFEAVDASIFQPEAFEDP
ncbi:MAG: hypothetical protein KDE27_14645 [Planctomycetes bacterium]|nr:hypothetical protein [Planctomycetota bacterium]